MTIETTTEVPGFRIRRELGRGAMGVVYLAEEASLGRLVALKVLRGAGEETEELRARFEREVKATARIQHPNVIPIHSTGEAGGHLWYAMPYVEGRSLDRVLREAPGGRLAEERAVRIAREIALSLAAAHAAGVVHRDVKPGNVMLLTQPPPDVEASSAGRRLSRSWLPAEGSAPPAVDRPLLVDFGLALDIGAAQLSRSGLLVGTPSHMAPEQFRGRPQDVGPAADLWSLGVLLFEMLTGRLPFPASDLPTLARTVCEVPAVPPSRLAPEIGRELDTIVLKCLEKDPEDRYPHATALAEDLGRWLREVPIHAHPPGRLRRLRTWSRHHPVRATLLAILVLGGVATAGGAAGVRIARANRAHALSLEAEARLAAGDLAGATASLDEWIALEPDAAEPREGRIRVDALRRIREAEGSFLEAQARMQQVRDGQRRLGALRRQALLGREASGGQGLGALHARGSEPWWMREPAYRAGVEARREAEAIARRRAELTDLLAAALSLVDAAHERAGAEGARVRDRIHQGAAAWHMEEWRRALAEGDRESAEVHRLAVQRLYPGPYEAEIAGDGALLLRVQDPTARAWVFRYVAEGESIPRGGPRLLPLPFDLASREVSIPEVYAEAVARRLEGEDPDAVEPDTPSVTDPFVGTETHLGTMGGPVSRERYARMLAGSEYPLVVGDANRIPLRDGAAEQPLPMGSYLLLLRAAGRADVRLPFVVRRSERVSLSPGPLPPTEAVPAGFVWIPEGRVGVGATDPLAIEPLAATDVAVGPFLAARFEVTFGEWWEFLNDPRTLAEIQRHRQSGWRFVPRLDGEPLVQADAKGQYALPASQPERPIAHVSLFDVAGYVEPPPGEELPRDDQIQEMAALLARSETVGWGYLRWRTERSAERAARWRAGSPDAAGAPPPDVVVLDGPGGGREVRSLRFSIPTVSEWERMGRGADRRTFVYGEEREWLAFKGARSRRSNPAPEPVGLFADDESVFGVRDLTGSVAEWTADWKEVGSLFWAKGSSWGSQTPEDDRIASRRAFPPAAVDPAVGVRLVVRETAPAP